MFVSIIFWTYLFICSFFQLEQSPSWFFSTPAGSASTRDIALSNAYGFAAGVLSPQVITRLPSSTVAYNAMPSSSMKDPTALGLEALEPLIEMLDKGEMEQDLFSTERFPHLDLRHINVKVKAHYTMNGTMANAPAIDDYDTVLSLAKISANAYVSDPELVSASWYSVDPFFREDGFGWDESAIRGYVYTNPSKTLVIMAIKGTSTAIFDGSGHTAAADKFNDNLMFSCCCARVDFSWDTVCPCFRSNSTCEQECLVEYAKRVRSFPFKKNTTIPMGNGLSGDGIRTMEMADIYPVYYYQAVKIYQQLKRDYPDATIWLTGHSLGGSLASLLAMTYPGTAAVAFSAPGERLFAERLGLLPLRTEKNEDIFQELMQSLPIFHIYNTADPIPYGKCSGIWSLCYLAGYAMETRCHLGHVCEYDIGPGKPFDLKKHKLGYLIEKIIMADYPLPTCRVQSDCFDCKDWTFA